MGLGQKIGDAYVAIHADGSGMDREIRDSLNDQDEIISGAGDRHGKVYHDAMADSWEKRLKQGEMRDAFWKNMGDRDSIEKFMEGGVWKELRAKLRKQFGEAGEVAGHNLEQGIIRGGDFDYIRNWLDNITPEIAKATEQIEAQQEVQHKQHLARLKVMDDAWRDYERKAMTQLRNDMALLNREMAQAVGGDRNAMRKGDLVKLLDGIRVSMARLHVDNDLWNESLRDNERSLRRLHPWIAKSNAAVDTWGDRVGKVFGRGSRNNFLNFVGSMVRGFVKIASLPMRAIEGFMNLGEAIGDIYKRGAEFGSQWGSLASKIAGSGAVFLTSAGGLIAVAGGLAAIVAIAGPVAAGISLIAGAVTAMAASLAFAAAGLGAGLVAVFAPMAAGALVAAAAFMGLSDAQKKALKADVKPITQAFKGLQETARTPLFKGIEGWAKDLGPVIDNLQGSVRGMSEALVRVGDSVVAGLKSNTFKTWADDVGKFMSGTEKVPGAIERVGDIAKNALGGVGGVFRGAIPFMKDALQWIDKIATRFSNWANSVKGQRQIGDFFESAKESLKDVGHFADEAWKFVKNLLNAGKGSGDSIFDSMGDAVGRWNDALKKDPDILKRWFADAQDLAGKLGRAAEAAGRLFDALDTPESRSNIKSVVDGISTAMRGLQGAVKVGNAAITGFKEMLSPFAWAAKKGYENLKSLFDLLSEGPSGVDSGTLLGNIIPIIDDAIDKFKILAGGVTGFFDGLKPGGKSPLEGFAAGVAGVTTELDRAERGAHGLDSAFGRIDTSTAAGIENAQRFAASFKDLPTDLRTKVSIDGMPESLGDIRSLVGQFKLTPKEVRSLIKLSGVDVSKAEMKQLMGDLDELGAKKPKPKILVDPKQALKAGDDVSLRLSELDDIRALPYVAMNKKDFDQGKQQVDNAMRDVDGKTSTVHINADNSDALNGISGVTAAMANMDTQKTITINVVRKMGGEPGVARGGIFQGPWGYGIPVRIGEAGAEAVVPLNRPLAQVDPAVRYLSAIAQGLAAPKMAAGGVAGGGKQINASGWTIVTQTKDPAAVAHEVVNQLVATGY